MRHVKLMMIGRHILAGLWLLVWLTASPGVQARVVNSGAATPAFAATDGRGIPHSNDLDGLGFQALRASRRFDAQSHPTGAEGGTWFFDTGVVAQHDVIGLHAAPETSVEIARSWQFLLRAALNPRAPSFVS